MRRSSDATDWGEASESFDDIASFVSDRDLSASNEAQTRYDVIDRMIREVLAWSHGQVKVEEPNEGERVGFVDYILRSGDSTIVVEAKRIGGLVPFAHPQYASEVVGDCTGAGRDCPGYQPGENLCGD